MQKWNLDELESELNKRKAAGELHQWRIVHSQTERCENYYIRDEKNIVATDQSRFVQKQQIEVRLELNKSGKKLGSAVATFYQTESLIDQIESLASSARLGDSDFWEYPEAESPEVQEYTDIDDGIRENVEKATNEISADIENTVRSVVRDDKENIFNSAELFVTRQNSEVKLSTGFRRKEQRSNIYTEFCFSARSEKLAEEYMVTRWAVNRDQLKINDQVGDSTRFARASLDTELPKAGEYAVIIDARILSQLLHDAVSHLHTGNKYLGMPHIATAEAFIPDFQGTDFTLSLDPTIKNCLESSRLSAEGLQQARIDLVKGNKVLENPTTKMYADFMHRAPTSHLGAICIEAEGKSIAELRKAAPKVLQIYQFSALFSNRNDLTYSSEIRLGKLYDNEKGTSCFVKGGSLSGNFKRNFKGVQFSDNIVLDNNIETMGTGLESYHGPDFALLSDVSISS